MDYYLLTELAARIGYHLALSGAETFRIEETMRRVIGAYGIECQAFSIPNCVMVSLEAANGKPLMVMKRVGFHGNDLEAVEKLNALSRRICAEVPEPSVAAQWLEETLRERRHYSTPIYYLGNFCGAAGFCPVFGGSLRDCLFAGLMGLIIGFVTRQMDKRETNPFFSTIAAAFAMAVPAYFLAGLHLIDYVDAVIIGSLMILVPGLLITNSMRDIIYGDTNSGINRIVQVLLSAFTIAMGTAAAWRVTAGVYGVTEPSGATSYPVWAQAIMIFLACTGFFILFNTHGWGSALCAAGGVLTWMVYLLCRSLGFSIYGMNCRHSSGALFRDHGALAQISGHVVSCHFEHSAAAWRGHLLHDEPRPGRRCAGGGAQRTRDCGCRGQHRRGDPAGVHGVPPCDRAAQKPNEIINSRKSAARWAALF